MLHDKFVHQRTTIEHRRSPIPLLWNHAPTLNQPAFTLLESTPQFEASHPPIEQSRSVSPQESTNRAASLHMATLPLLPVFVLAFLLAPAVRASPDVTVVSTLCNSAAYTGGDPFAISLAYILADLLKAAPDRRGHDYYNISPYPNAFAYGHAACKANLTASDCATCLRYAEGQMNSTCGMRIGARSVLVDCTTRYEQYPFRN